MIFLPVQEVAVETQQWRNVSWNLSDVSEKDKVRTNLLAMTRLCIKVTVPLEMAIFKSEMR